MESPPSNTHLTAYIKWTCILVGFWGFFLSLGVFAMVLSSRDENASPLEMFGSLGDTFNVFNSLVTTLALAGAFITIWLQRDALARQDNNHGVQLRCGDIQFRLGKLEQVCSLMHDMKQQSYHTMLDAVNKAEPISPSMVVAGIMDHAARASTIAGFYFSNIKVKIDAVLEQLSNFHHKSEGRPVTGMDAIQSFHACADAIEEVRAECMRQAELLNALHGQLSYSIPIEAPRTGLS